MTDKKPDSDLNSDGGFEQRLTTFLRAQPDRLGGKERSRLNRSRQQALAELGSGPAASRHAGLLPLTGMVAASLLVAVAWFGDFNSGIPGQGVADSGSQAVIEAALPGDFDVLTVEEDFELLQDLDFYSWLQSVPAGPGQGPV